jgi:hypothetical protein
MRLVLGVPSSEVTLGLGRREWKYLKLIGALVFGFMSSGVLVLTLLLVGGVVFAGFDEPRTHIEQNLGVALMGIFFFLAVYVGARCSVAFPAIAVDNYRGLRTHFRQTRNNGWRIIAIVAVVSAPGILIGLAMARLGRTPPAISLLLAAVTGISTAVFGAFTHTASAVIYGALGRDSAPSTPLAGD